MDCDVIIEPMDLAISFICWCYDSVLMLNGVCLFELSSVQKLEIQVLSGHNIDIKIHEMPFIGGFNLNFWECILFLL